MKEFWRQFFISSGIVTIGIFFIHIVQSGGIGLDTINLFLVRIGIGWALLLILACLFGLFLREKEPKEIDRQLK